MKFVLETESIQSHFALGPLLTPGCPAAGLGGVARAEGHFQLRPQLLLFYQVVLDLAPLNCA